ncbi:DUF3017 domain-containing protein [Streptomyces sp. NPDC051567]|uniref:DUF3017 domain-containing protein n=1 Tax=Streptomyces sp. NPDC051567 TaxID=3365660 RepID=UPI0037B38B50
MQADPGAEPGTEGAPGTSSGGGESGTGSGSAKARSAPGAGTGARAGTRASKRASGAGAGGSRRFPSLTQGTARPEGGGRAAAGGAPAPARQWPMLSVLAATAAGLLVTALGQARIGCLLIGVALIAGAVMRRVLPSVGMLAVRSRFTDMITYGLLGVAITLLALVMEPKPWLEIPFLESALRFTVR